MAIGLGPINDIGQQLMDELRSGRPSRVSLGVKDQAWAWSLGAPRTFANFCATAQAESMSFGIVKAGPSGTPVASVAEKAPKPAAITLTAGTVPLGKYAGLSTFTLEDVLSTAGLVSAITTTLLTGGLLAYERDVAAAIVAGKGSTVEGASWTEGVLKAVGEVVAHGGNPDLIAISAADFAAAISGATGLVFNGGDAIPTFLGLKVHMSPGLTAGTAVVLDSRAVLCVEHRESPVVIVDSMSQAATNELRVICDVVAGVGVLAPGSIVTVTKSGS
jgi:hypothetical protein